MTRPSSSYMEKEQEVEKKVAQSKGFKSGVFSLILHSSQSD